MNCGLGLMETVQEPTSATYSPSVLRQAFSRFPTGVAAICGMGARSVPVGMVVNSFTSVSLDPILISANFARSSKTWMVLRYFDSLGVSVLADNQHSTCAALASPRPQDRFAGVKWRKAPTGSAVFVDDAVVRMQACLVSEFGAGDHTVAIMRLQSIQVVSDRHPLVFYRSQYHILDLPEPGSNLRQLAGVTGPEAAPALNTP